MAQVRLDFDAVDRLARLGLTVGQFHRALARADAEARMTNDLEPPNLGGMNRWGKGVRFLREELLPHGWGYDNSFNFCRTIHPSGEFAIVMSSGDDFAGEYVADLRPSTKYSKGETVVRAVETNEQFSLDLGQGFEDPEEAPTPSGPVTWFLLFRATIDKVYAELSLPSAIEGGVISNWRERIILPPLDRDNDASLGQDERPDDGDGYDVDVSMR